MKLGIVICSVRGTSVSSLYAIVVVRSDAVLHGIISS